MKRATFAALAVLLVGAVIAAGRAHRAQMGAMHAEAGPLLSALAAAKQPAAAASAVRAACSGADGCGCAEAEARAALDGNLHGLALKTLDAAPKTCPRSALLLGERAEALARAGSGSAQESADLALKADAQNQYAELALALIRYDKNEMSNTAEHAQKALELGRGAEAERLLGRSAMARNKYKEAELHFQNVLKQDPDDEEAAFSSGVCADKAGDYLGAREGFLQTLRIDPKQAQARAYLVVLTHNAGANGEARHHLAKLAEVVPKDSPELVQLRQLLDGTTDAGSASALGVTKTDAGLMVHGEH